MLGKLNGLMVVVAEIVLLTLPVSAQQNRASGPDQELVTRLHQLGQDEIAAARMGAARGVRVDVVTFAETLQRGHLAMDQGLMVYAQKKNMDRVQVALPGGALEHSTLALAPLANSPRNEFDYTFVSKAVADHQAVIDAATAAQRLARDPELRRLIGDMLVMLSDHLVSAQQLLAGIPAPTPGVVQLPAYPSGASRTQTGADVPPPGAWQPITP